jgi:hypothetical protein
MNDPDIIWRRTFPDSKPSTDGVAIFEGPGDWPRAA